MDTKFSIGADHWSGLSKLIEEAGEVTQVAGKLMGVEGAEQHWDGSNLRTRLVEELGDLTAAINFFVDQNLTEQDTRELEQRTQAKQLLFQRWHDERANRIAPEPYAMNKTSEQRTQIRTDEHLCWEGSPEEFAALPNEGFTCEECGSTYRENDDDCESHVDTYYSEPVFDTGR